jgi:hypothetical protein
VSLFFVVLVLLANKLPVCFGLYCLSSHFRICAIPSLLSFACSSHSAAIYHTAHTMYYFVSMLQILEGVKDAVLESVVPLPPPPKKRVLITSKAAGILCPVPWPQKYSQSDLLLRRRSLRYAHAELSWWLPAHLSEPKSTLISKAQVSCMHHLGLDLGYLTQYQPCLPRPGLVLGLVAHDPRIIQPKNQA